MKNILMILFVVTLFAVASLGQQTAPQHADVNWLDAPTPDSSPTLRETSDWLGKTLPLYGGGSTWNGSLLDANRVLSASIDNDCNLNLAIDYATNTNKNAERRVKHAHFSHEVDAISVPLGAGVMVAWQGDVHPVRHWIEIQTPGRQSIQVVAQAANPDDYVVNTDTGLIQLIRAATPAKRQPGRPSYTPELQIDLLVSTGPAPDQTPGAEIPPSTYDMGPRIVNALQHAVSLCRGTYKTPVQAKQPF